jgi:hypothetical protein
MAKVFYESGLFQGIVVGFFYVGKQRPETFGNFLFFVHVN